MVEKNQSRRGIIVIRKQGVALASSWLVVCMFGIPKVQPSQLKAVYIYVIPT